MRWMWIDRIVKIVPGRELVAVKTVSLSEDHLYQHFGDSGDTPAQPVMPASLILEGCAQAGGLLVGHAGDFKEKVILAKIPKASIEREAAPGQTLRYTATLERLDPAGALVNFVIELFDTPGDAPATIGTAEIVFSHADQNMAGLDLPEDNFVFAEAFSTLLASSGLPACTA